MPVMIMEAMRGANVIIARTASLRASEGPRDTRGA
jgi:hypothetical protein